jgi:hypothetical protein
MDFTEQLKEAVNRSAPVEDSDFGVGNSLRELGGIRFDETTITLWWFQILCMFNRVQYASTLVQPYLGWWSLMITIVEGG